MKNQLKIIVAAIICVAMGMYVFLKRYPIEDDGYQIIPNVLTAKECDNLLQLINNAQKKKMPVGEIHSQNNREDRMIPMDKVKKYISKIYNKTECNWRNIIGSNPLVCECSSLMSYPGSEHQIWHTDTSYRFGDASLLSIGIALEDIDRDMGPLNVYKGSHNMYTEDMDQLFNDYEIESVECSLSEEGLCSQAIEKICIKKGYKLKKCVAKKGDLVAWQSSVVHRGSANGSDKLRPVFYFSLMSSLGNEPFGSTYSTMDERKFVKHLN
jgi:hypothetical protein